MNCNLLLALLLLTSPAANAQKYVGTLTPVATNGTYASIEFLSTGESVNVSPEPSENERDRVARTKRLRLVVYRSEVYQSVRIETLAEGLEGCCARVTSARALDLEAFANHFGFKGEATGFTFVGWISPQAFTFSYQAKLFSATVNGTSSIAISRL